jgi:hypothetical protein
MATNAKKEARLMPEVHFWCLNRGQKHDYLKRMLEESRRTRACARRRKARA